MKASRLSILLLPALAVACGSADPRPESEVRYVPMADGGRSYAIGGGGGGDGGAYAPAPAVPPGDEAWSGVVAERCRSVEPLMRVAAVRHGVDVGLIAGIIRTESTFEPTARSRAGATGLMQVMPSIGRRLSCGELTDPEANIDCGLTILKRFMARYDDRLVYGLSAYHAGYRPANEARDAGTVPTNLRYVEKVLGYRATYLRHGCGR